MVVLDFLYKIFATMPMMNLIIPLCLLTFIVLYPFKSKLTWLLTVIPTGLFVFLLFFSAVWILSGGHYTRYIVVVLYFVAGILSFLKIRKSPLLLKPNLGVGLLCAFGILAVIVLGILNVNIFRAHVYSETPFELQFPFRDGTYLIADGGDGSISNLVNYHYQDARNISLRYNKSERYANDIVMIDSFGFEGKHWGNEKSLDDYYIFGENVYSPCDGVIFEVQDGFDDIPPNGTVTDTGNGVVILLDGVYVVLWHLEKGSIVVAEGDTVKAGDLLGTIGNSGITGTPHLHIQVSRGHYMYGVGVPVLYDGRNPIKNTLFKQE